MKQWVQLSLGTGSGLSEDRIGSPVGLEWKERLVMLPALTESKLSYLQKPT